MSKVLMAEVNVSEGKDSGLIEKLKQAIVSVEGIEVIGIEPDADHDRTVFTYKGEPTKVLEATKKLVSKAIELIDMTKHKGSHPRMGSVDILDLTGGPLFGFACFFYAIMDYIGIHLQKFSIDSIIL
ncbi:hypothetical protein [Gudongella sp. DL1XJH-153]|uniref:hypothetical protein n=1 Tax=Gudongella sp. DL1XJH-153 TaxID=3409804 RepID=UPI003BB63388